MPLWSQKPAAPVPGTHHKPLPIVNAPPHEGAIPHFYTVVLHTHRCACGAVHKFSEIHARTILRGLTGKTPINNLRRLFPERDLPAYNLPVELMRKKPVRIPFCFICAASVSLKHLPSPPPPETTAPLDLRDMAVIQRSPSGPRDGMGRKGYMVPAEAIEAEQQGGALRTTPRQPKTPKSLTDLDKLLDI